jgi:hypothetical protein
MKQFSSHFNIIHLAPTNIDRFDKKIQKSKMAVTPSWISKKYQCFRMDEAILTKYQQHPLAQTNIDP